MAVVRIRIVAQNDPSLKRSILDYVGMVNKADKAIVQSSQRAQADKMRTVQGGYRQSARAEVQHTALIDKEEAKRARIQERNLKNLARIKDRSLANFQRDEERGARESVVRAKAIGREATATFTKVTKAALGLSLGAGAAIGVDTSASSIISKGVGFEKAIVDLSNSGAKGAASKSDIATNRSAVVGAAEKTFTDVNQMAEALGKYTSLTGDIETGRASLEMFGKLARATGSDVGDIAGAAAQIANGLGDVPDKAKIVAEALRTVAQQGKLGSVEIKDLAVHMGKFASKAQFFQGTRQDTIATLGAMAQMAMKGGASTAPEAASSAGNFGRDVMTDAAADAFKGLKINRFTDASEKKLRDPVDLIVDALKATKGSAPMIQELFRNSSSRKAILGARSTFEQAGGGEAGEKAVRAEFKKFRESISESDVESMFQNSASTTEAKATAFNNKMQELGTKVIDAIMPSAERLAPALLKLAEHAPVLAEAFASLVSFAAENPFAAVGAMLAASLVSSGIGEAIKSSLTRSIGGAGIGGAISSQLSLGIAAGLASISWGYVFDNWKNVSEAANLDKTEAGHRDEDAANLLRGQGKTKDDYAQPFQRLEHHGFLGNERSYVYGGKGGTTDYTSKVENLPNDGTGGIGGHNAPVEITNRIAEAWAKADAGRAEFNQRRDSLKEQYGYDLAPSGKEAESIGLAEQFDKLASGNKEGSEALVSSLTALLGGTLTVHVANMPAGGPGGGSTRDEPGPSPTPGRRGSL